MAAFFSVTLAVSMVGLITLLVLKHYEINSNRVFLGRVRPVLGNFFHRVLVFFERGVPSAMRAFVLRAARAGRSRMHQVLVQAVLLSERGLEYALHLVRQKSQTPRGEGVASQFLQEVAAHKQKLLRRTPSKRMIFDE